ncbi:MAG: hypothetical protein WBY94_09820 [Polyangiaceae bacterium]
MSHEWSPNYAPHVKGHYEDREIGPDGEPEEAEVGAECGICGAAFKRKCKSGLMREWISRFAIAHLHRDPLSTPKKGF